jgi:hypothetical protein
VVAAIIQYFTNLYSNIKWKNYLTTRIK